MNIVRTCEICKSAEIFHSDDSGDYCEPCYLEGMKQGALDAGIPLSVIEGKTKLTDHFSPEYIKSQCSPNVDCEDFDAQDRSAFDSERISLSRGEK